MVSLAGAVFGLADGKIDEEDTVGISGAGCSTETGLIGDVIESFSSFGGESEVGGAMGCCSVCCTFCRCCTGN